MKAFLDYNGLKKYTEELKRKFALLSSVPILEGGIIPSRYMPSYVDDVLEFDSKDNFPETGESGKIYVDISTNLTYRWGGTAYVEISPSLALGNTSSTAFRGDWGKIAYDHSQKSHNFTIAGTSVSALGGSITSATLKASLGISSLEAYFSGGVAKEAAKVSNALTISNGVTSEDYDGSSPVTLTKTSIGLSQVENIKLSTWTGSTKITTLGTITTGVWNGTKIANDYLANSIITIGTTSINLGDTATAFEGLTSLKFAGASGALTYNSTDKYYNLADSLVVNGILAVGESGTGTSSGYTQLEWSDIQRLSKTEAGNLASAYAVKEVYTELNTAINTLASSATKVSFAPNLTGGKVIGTLTIDGTGTILYAPQNYAWGDITGKPTTIAGYGITDAKIANGVITIGSNTITPLTSHQKVSLASGTNNGTLKLTVGNTTTDNIAVKGLGSAAYTNSDAYAAASHTHSQYLTAHQTIYTLTIQKNGTQVDTYTPNSANKTINISDVASATTLSNHTGDKVSHITAAERTAWNTVAGLFGVDENGDVYVKNDKDFYTGGFLSAGSPGSGSSGGGYTQYEWDAIKLLTQSESGLLASAYSVKEAYNELNTAIETLAGKATNVTFTQTIKSGKQIGSISIDGKSTSLFAPANYAWSEVTGKPTFATVATSGSYSDLTNKPTIASLMGSTAIGGTSSYLYWNGSAWATKALGTAAFASSSDFAAASHSHSNYVDLTSQQTITGNKIFSGDVRIGDIGINTEGTGLYLYGAGHDKLEIYSEVKLTLLGEGGIYIGNPDNSSFVNILEDMRGVDENGSRWWSISRSGEALFSSISGSLANSLAIKLNGGTTEGTNLFTFNNSTSKTINITPSAIGAAAASHTHSYLPLSGGTMANSNKVTNLNADLLDGYHASQVVTAVATSADLNEISVPSIYRLSEANPNLPSAIFSYGNLLTVRAANTDTAWQLIGSYNYDALWFRRGTWYANGTGSLRTNAWKEIAFTDSNVASASKWANARTITLTGSVTGSVSIDGSANVSLATTTNHTHTFASITSKPTTISGYGITDALTTANYNSYAPTLTGTGASGTWGISISGNAATATNADTLDGYHASQVVTAVATSADLNEISVPSIYRLSEANPNLPSAIFSYGNLLTVRAANTDTAWQLIGSYDYDALWFRRGTWYANGTGSLRTNAWKEIAFTDSNVASASKWANARTITLTGSVTGSVSIDGSANVSLATTTNHTHTFASITSKPTTISGYGITDALTTSNFNSYAPKLDGTGASGTWGINISGNAATATNADTLDGLDSGSFIRNRGRTSTSSESIDANSVWINSVKHDYRWTNTPVNGIASLLDLTYSYDWRSQIFVSHSGKTYIAVRSRYKGTTWGNWRELAFTDSNIASAQALTHSNGTVGAVVDSSGNVGIGTTSPSYKLHVAGTGYYSENVVVDGDLAVGSDIRYKNKVQDLGLSVHDIALAPAFAYKWKDKEDNLTHIGTSAQYWLGTNAKDAVCYDKEKDFYRLNYATLALCNTIILARGMETQEEKITRLEERINELEDKLRQYDSNR